MEGRGRERPRERETSKDRLMQKDSKHARVKEIERMQNSVKRQTEIGRKSETSSMRSFSHFLCEKLASFKMLVHIQGILSYWENTFYSKV